MINQRRISIHLSAFLAVLFLCLLPLRSLALYTVTDLGILTNVTGLPADQWEATINAVNLNGKCLGITVSNANYNSFLYGGSRTNLGTLGGNYCSAHGIGGTNGSIICGKSLNASGFQRAFRWTPGGTGGVANNPQMADLGVLSAGNDSAGIDINASGQIAGYSSLDAANTAYDACRFNTNGTITDIGALLPANFSGSFGYGINTAGQVVGTAYDANFTAIAFFYNNTNVALLGDFTGPGGNNGSEAYAINTNRNVCGYAITAIGEYHAFRWRTNLMTDLGTLGGTESYAWGINSSNVIVGNSKLTGDLVDHAFIAPGNSLIDLNSQLDTSSNGWVLIKAEYINDAGMIVGYGTNNSELHGFLLTLVGPGVAPNITNQPSPASVIVSNNATFNVVAGGTAPLAYQWRLNGTNISYGTGTSLTITNAQATNAGSYTVVITNNYGSITSSPAALTVNFPPTISAQPSSPVSVIVSNNATFTVTASGTATLIYQWRLNGTNIGYGTGTSLTITNAQATNAGNYTVVITNNYGSITSSPAALTVNFPPSIGTPPASQSVLVGSNATFSVIAAGTSPLAYQWRFASNLNGQTNTSYTVTNAQAGNAGNYSVVVTNSYGGVTSALAYLNVVPVPVLASIKVTNANVLLGFNTSTGATYSVEARTNLSSGSWQSAVTNIAGIGGLKSVTHTNGAGRPLQAYRVRVTVP
jgi:probable HAF family extracellular repeat protein